MKRYDLAGSASDCKQFGAKQFWVVKLNSRFDAWVSYNTVVAIVDNQSREVIEGECAKGFSRTTSKQVGQAYGEFAQGYSGVAYNSDKYHEFNRLQGWEQINNWGDEWGKYNAASAATYFLYNRLR